MWMIHDAATGRRMNPGERLFFSGAARDPRVAEIFDAFGARQIGVGRMMATGMPMAAMANARYALGGRRRGGAKPVPGAGGGGDATIAASAPAGDPGRLGEPEHAGAGAEKAA